MPLSDASERGVSATTNSTPYSHVSRSVWQLTQRRAYSAPRKGLRLSRSRAAMSAPKRVLCCAVLCCAVLCRRAAVVPFPVEWQSRGVRCGRLRFERAADRRSVRRLPHRLGRLPVRVRAAVHTRAAHIGRAAAHAYTRRPPPVPSRAVLLCGDTEAASGALASSESAHCSTTPRGAAVLGAERADTAR